MRKFTIFFLMFMTAILFGACKGPVDPVVDPPQAVVLPNMPEIPAGKHVYNSAWQPVKPADLKSTSRATAREIELTFEEFLLVYNAGHTDDQLFMTDGEVPITEAPSCEVWIADVITNLLKFMPGTTEPYHLTGVPRTDVVDRREAWRIECQGIGNAVLYVDHAPPDPVDPPPPDMRPDFEKYAVYLIDGAGAILLEEHCENIYDYPSKQAYFEARIYAFTMEKLGHPDWAVISGQLYTPTQG